MLKAYKYRIYPTSEQKIYFAKTFGCIRFIYNQMLSDRIKSYEENKDLDIKKIKYPTPAQYKKEYEWLKEVDSLALAKAISEVSWAEFRTMLEYKANWHDREIIIAPSNYASSQLCSECGYKNSDVKNLALRNWTCPSCGANHDRDVNASINLLKLAI